MASKNPSIVRKAGSMERYHIVRSQVGFDSCVVVSARYTSAGSAALLDRETLYPALSAVIHQIGALSVQVGAPRKPKASPPYVRLSTVALADVVSFVEEDLTDYPGAMGRVLEAQIAVPFKLGAATPLWRVTVVSGHTVVFKYHHGIGDGQSGMAFHRALLSALNTPRDTTSGASGATVSVPDSASLVPPLEDMTDVSVSCGTFCRVLFHTIAPASITKPASAWTGNRIAQTPSEVTNVRCWEIAADDVAQLLALCRKADATLTTFLHTLLLGVFSRHVAGLNAEKGGKKFKTISSYMPNSLRRFTGVSPYEMCVHVSVFHFSSPVAPFPDAGISCADFPWPTAAKLNTRLRSRAKKTRELAGLARYIFVLGMHESFWTDTLGKKRDGAFEISNLGRFPAPQAGKGEENAAWTANSLYFAQCDAVSGSALKCNVAGSPTGAVNVAFTWGLGALEDAVVETVIREVKTGLSSILASSSSKQ